MKNNEEQWPRCAEHPNCQYQYLSLTKQINQQRLLCTECLYSKQESKQKLEIIESIPLSIVLSSPEIMIDQIKNDLISKQVKDLFNFCESNIENQFNEQIKKFELLIIFFNQIKDQIKQQFNQYKGSQEQIRKIRDEFNEKFHFNQLQILIEQLKVLDKQFKSDQYNQILSKINSMLDDMMKNNYSFISLKIDEVIRNLRELKLNQNDQLLSDYNQLFREYSVLLKGLNKNIASYKLKIPKFESIRIQYFQTLIKQKSQRALKLNETELIIQENLNKEKNISIEDFLAVSRCAKSFIQKFDSEHVDILDIIQSLIVEIGDQGKKSLEQFTIRNNESFSELLESCQNLEQAYEAYFGLKQVIMKEIAVIYEMAQQKMKIPRRHFVWYIKQCPFCGLFWIKVGGCDYQTTCGKVAIGDNLIHNQQIPTRYKFKFDGLTIKYEEEQRQSWSKGNEYRFSGSKEKESTVGRIGCGKPFIWSQLKPVNFDILLEMLNPQVAALMTLKIEQNLILFENQNFKDAFDLQKLLLKGLKN